MESNNELHEKSGSPKDSDTTQRVERKTIQTSTGKHSHKTGLTEHISSPLQVETQLNGPNMNKTNSKVLDESPGFSNLNDVNKVSAIIVITLFPHDIA